MKTLHCTTGDGCSMEVSDEVAAILDLMGVKTFYIENREPARACKGCYIDALARDSRGDRYFLDMRAMYTWEEAYDMFVQWVMDGCEPTTDEGEE